MMRRAALSALKCPSGRSTMVATTNMMITQSRFRSDADRKIESLEQQLASMKERLDKIERENELNQLVAFNCTVPKAQLDLNEVVSRCEDPNYNQFIFCHRQLPLLLARMIRKIDNFPLGLNTMPSIRRVRSLYMKSFDLLQSCPLPVNKSSEKDFYEIVADRDEAHQEILTTMAAGVLEIKHSMFRHKSAIIKMHNKPSRNTSSSNLDDLFEPPMAQHPNFRETPSRKMIFADLLKIQEPLDAFNTLMVEYRFLSRQFLHTMRDKVDGLKMNEDDDDDGLRVEDVNRIGMVNKDLDLVKVVRAAVNDAKEICNGHYGDSPDVDIVLAHKSDENPVTFAHLGDNIFYIMCELLKNALRATVDRHMKRNALGIVTCEDMPPITVTISVHEEQEEGVVCICDEGGGIKRTDLDKVMSYTYTTSPKPILESAAESEEDDEDNEVNPTPLAGYGYGLPMSRIYARCFGGDVKLQSVEGFGTKAYLYVAKKKVGNTHGR